MTSPPDATRPDEDWWRTAVVALSRPAVRPAAPQRGAVDKLQAAARSYLTHGNAAIAKDWSEF